MGVLLLLSREEKEVVLVSTFISLLLFSISVHSVAFEKFVNNSNNINIINSNNNNNNSIVELTEYILSKNKTYNTIMNAVEFVGCCCYY